LTDIGNAADKTHIVKAFANVAKAPTTAGIKIPFMLRVLLNKPQTYPIIVLTMQCSPMGAAVKKSSISPETNPFVTPYSFPLLLAK
jgi:hypothetical protein